MIQYIHRILHFGGVRVVALLVLYPQLRRLPGAMAITRWVMWNAPGFHK